MRFLGRDIREGDEPYDVCLIGSGPSGMTVALELKSRGLRICVLESGLASPDASLDDLKAVESEGLTIRPDSRERVLGGTSTTWSGFIAPLDPIDFEPRPGLHDGWPISLQKIQSEIDRSGHRYGIPAAEAFARDDGADTDRKIPAMPSLQPKIFHTQVPPFNFGKTFAYTFLPTDFDIYLGATVTRFEREHDAGPISAAVVVDDLGETRRIRAKTFVLAASAIETVRILFNSGGLGNARDQLGRYFMNHPKGDVATAVLDRPIAADHEILQCRYQNFEGYVGLRLAEDLQRQNGYLNSYVRFEPLRGGGEYPKAKELSRRFKAVMKAVGRRDGKAVLPALGEMFRHAGGLPQLVVRGVHRATKPKQTSMDAVRIRCFVEMEPLAEQRIVPGEATDRFGMPIPKVTHFLSEHALASVDRLLETVAQDFAAAGFGKVTRVPQPLSELLSVDASHHLGGARTGSDPATSVVSPELRLHEAGNLYVAGGAVFPTGGSANPTQTMIGLSIGLATTIATELNAAEPSPPAKSGQGVIIVGAGRRVSEDIVPAVEALSPDAHIQAIFATSRKAVFGPAYVHEVRPLAGLTQDDIVAARIVYVAVPTKRLAAVLQQLTQQDCRHLTLVVDTPAVDPKAVGGLYERFGQVVVAEDAAFLPWIDLVRQAGKIRHIDIDRSGFRYHAVAMARALAGEKRPAVSALFGKKNDIGISFANGPQVHVRGPRDYDVGVLTIEMGEGGKISSHKQAGSQQIECLRTGHVCTGFRLGEKTIALSPLETALLGRVTDRDTIVSRMLDIKRVGLYRLLRQVLQGEIAYGLAEALEDNSPDW